MSNKILLTTTLLTSLVISANTMASGDTHWGYSGDTGPAHWGTLHPSYSTCSSGRNQSPVNLTNMLEGDLPAIKFKYQQGGNTVLNNGHTIQVNYIKGSTMSIDGKSFELKQFHFHSPGENTIKGKSFPMEAHLVHADKQGNLAVVAVMFDKGGKNSELEKAWSKMPATAGKKQQLVEPVNINQLLPKDRDYYRFTGSLTTPPCSEGVRWFVMKKSVSASKQQLEKFAHIMQHPNNRPVQPLNARVVIQ